MADNTFSGWLNRELLRRDWKQADFARRLGISSGTVNTWVKGTRRPTPESCDRIADVLFIDRDIVLAKSGHRPLDEPLEPDDPRAQIVADLHHLTDAAYLDLLAEFLTILLAQQRARKGTPLE